MTSIRILICVLALFVTAPQLIATPPSADAVGPYAVGFTMLTVVDTSRAPAAGFSGRPVLVYVWYPVDRSAITSSTPQAIYALDPLYKPSLLTTSSDWEKYGLDRAYQEPSVSSDRPFPLLVFSPGLGAKAWAHIYLATRLASHGFVVAVTSHTGDRFSGFGWEPPNPGVRPIGTVSLERPRDMSFALTKILEQNETPGALLADSIDPPRIAGGGWSLGGYAAMVLAAGDDLVCDHFANQAELCVANPPDTRIKTLVLLDASNQLLYFYELARVTIPVLSLGREWNDLAVQGPIASWQARQHAAFNGHPSYRVDVAQTLHPTFANTCELTQVLGDKGVFTPAQVAARMASFCTNTLPSDENHRLVNEYAVAFLKTVLNGETGYQSMLTAGWALMRETNVEFFVTEKRDDQAIDDDQPGFFTYFMHQPGSQQARDEKDPAVMPPLDDSEP